MDAQGPCNEQQFALAPYSYAAVRELVRALELPEPVAVALARRGYADPAAAQAFLDADESHDASEFDGIDAAVAAIVRAIKARERITVHGDYDVDGVTATAILVAALRELGAECDWLIPSRTEDGYGLGRATVERLADRGTALLVTADCGITSAAEVATARELGLSVVVTDHHEPPDVLPDCPLVHPLVSGYPCPDLCAAAVAHKLVACLAGTERAERDLDLVALATVADLVPLVGENRTLVRRGLEHLRRGSRPGLRALAAAAQVLPERISERDLGFRLAPRINAAGRLYRADAAVELLLTEDEERARQIAAELDRANRERRETESAVLADAERQLRELEAEGQARPAIVLWGEGWHPGVIGICASRLAERHGRPTVLIALVEEGARGTGSGRSVPGFDLLAALRACEPLLVRYGGHRAAAGLEIERGRLGELRDGLCAHVREVLPDGPPARPQAIDAVVGAEALTHDVAEQVARLGPFGKGNPGITLLVPAARIADVRPMGEGERHARFSVQSGAARAPGVAFGVGASLEQVAETGPVDVSLRLELNEWNGAVAPRSVLEEVHVRTPGSPSELRCPEPEFARRYAAELTRDPGPVALPARPAPARERLDPGGSDVARVAELASSGEALLVLCADVPWRRGLVDELVDPARFGGGQAALVAARGSLEEGVAAAERLLLGQRGGIALADWQALELCPDLAQGFPHVVLADPAPREEVAALAIVGDGYLHALRSHSDPALALRALGLALPGRDALAAVFRSMCQAGPGPHEGAEVRRAVEAGLGEGRSPEWCGQAVRTLCEAGVLRPAGSDVARPVEVVSSVRGELDLSPSYAANKQAHEERVRFLTKGKEQRSSPLPAAA